MKLGPILQAAWQRGTERRLRRAMSAREGFALGVLEALRLLDEAERGGEGWRAARERLLAELNEGVPQ